MRKMGSWGCSETEDWDIDLIMLLVPASAHSLAISRFRCARAQPENRFTESSADGAQGSGGSFSR